MDSIVHADNESMSPHKIKGAWSNPFQKLRQRVQKVKAPQPLSSQTTLLTVPTKGGEYLRKWVTKRNSVYKKEKEKPKLPLIHATPPPFEV